MARSALGRRLASARIARGLRQRDVAKRLRVHPYTVTRWETGGTEPSLEVVRKLGRVLEVEFLWLVDGHGEGPALVDENVIRRVCA